VVTAGHAVYDTSAAVQVLRVGKGDACLTLTSGGCNAINMCLQGATSVTAVDCNPAQSALLEMKAIAIRCATHSTFCCWHVPRYGAPLPAWSFVMQ
jgi:S-adenosylmethionine:diacylglycerol 3-amino-3-carboxypropyl transferase